MPTEKVFGRLVCKCGECGHVWMVEGDKEPERCGNAKKRCRGWNEKPARPTDAVNGELRQSDDTPDTEPKLPKVRRTKTRRAVQYPCRHRLSYCRICEAE
jgi:hypothetical protein